MVSHLPPFPNQFIEAMNRFRPCMVSTALMDRVCLNSALMPETSSLELRPLYTGCPMDIKFHNYSTSLCPIPLGRGVEA